QGGCAHCPTWYQSPEDGSGGRRQGGSQPLPGNQSFPCPHPCTGQAGDRPHAPDPCPHEPYSLSAGGRQHLWWSPAHTGGRIVGTDRDVAQLSAPGAACPAIGTGTS